MRKAARGMVVTERAPSLPRSVQPALFGCGGAFGFVAKTEPRGPRGTAEFRVGAVGHIDRAARIDGDVIAEGLRLRQRHAALTAFRRSNAFSAQPDPLPAEGLRALRSLEQAQRNPEPRRRNAAIDPAGCARRDE